MNIALITGASSGIGREFVRQIARSYPSLDEIWVIARRKKCLLRLQQELPFARLRILTLDLEQTESFSFLEAQLQRDKPCIRILINSAGNGAAGDFASQELLRLLSMADLNCRALLAVTRLSLPYMKKGSRILQISSGAAFLPQPGFAVYAASKSCVLSFSRALREELKKRKITVTAVCPGPVDTEFFQNNQIQQKAWKRPFFTQPERVVKKALLDAQANRAVSVCGGSMAAVRVLGKLLPTEGILCLVNLLSHKSI